MTASVLRFLNDRPSVAMPVNSPAGTRKRETNCAYADHMNGPGTPGKINQIGRLRAVPVFERLREH